VAFVICAHIRRGNLDNLGCVRLVHSRQLDGGTNATHLNIVSAPTASRAQLLGRAVIPSLNVVAHNVHVGWRLPGPVPGCGRRPQAEQPGDQDRPGRAVEPDGVVTGEERSVRDRCRAGVAAVGRVVDDRDGGPRGAFSTVRVSGGVLYCVQARSAAALEAACTTGSARSGRSLRGPPGEVTRPHGRDRQVSRLRSTRSRTSAAAIGIDIRQERQRGEG